MNAARRVVALRQLDIAPAVPPDVERRPGELDVLVPDAATRAEVDLLVGALVHGFAHTGIDPFGLVIGSLLYGLPTALLFIKKDFEHAVGYHFLIDFVRFVAALLNG